MNYKAIIAILLAVFGIAYAQNTRTPAVQPAPQPPTGSANRYQIVMSPVNGQNAFLLDTQTGKAWQWVTFTDLENEPKAWMAKPRIDSEADLAKWALTQAPKKQ